MAKDGGRGPECRGHQSDVCGANQDPEGFGCVAGNRQDLCTASGNGPAGVSFAHRQGPGTDGCAVEAVSGRPEHREDNGSGGRVQGEWQGGSRDRGPQEGN